MMIEEKLISLLALKRSEHLYRQRNQSQNDHEIQFSSNDYLSLNTEPDIKRGYLEGIQKYPLGSGGSMVVSGHHEMHKHLEAIFADFLGVDDCLLMCSGYTANLSLSYLLSQLGVHVVMDKAIHASIYDGMQANRIPFSRYSHQNIAQMMNKINEVSESKILLTESVFSMSGQIAPLREMADYCQSKKIPMIVDEAHAFGLVGREGRGAVDVAALTQEEVPLRIIPLGKAMASAGAIVAGKKSWIDAFVQYARPYIYSTGMSPAQAYGIEKTLQFIRRADSRREKINELVEYFRHKIQNSAWTWRSSVTPIQQLQTACPEKATELSQKLKDAGFICMPMRQPTVPRKETGLRVILNHAHNAHIIDKFFAIIDNHDSYNQIR